MAELKFDVSKVFPAQEPKRPRITLPSSGDKPRILLADTDPVYALTLFHTLAQAGYEVVVVENGTDAVTELRKVDHPAVAILQSKMPGMDGSEICERMRDAEKDVYLILGGDASESADIVSGLESGAHQYLRKSIPPEELLAHVKVGLRIISRLKAQNVENPTG